MKSRTGGSIISSQSHYVNALQTSNLAHTTQDRGSKHSTCSTFPMRGWRSWSRLFSGTCSHSRIWSSWLFLRVWSLISVRPNRTWMTPSCWNGGPVSTWYRSRSVFPDGDYSVSRLETCSLAWPAPATGYPFRFILAGACRWENWSIRMLPRNNGHCPLERTQTPGHKTRSVSLWLSFRHFLPVSFSRCKKRNWSIRRERCCRASPLLSLSAEGLINARPQSMHLVGLWLLTKRVDCAPLRQVRNILKARKGVLNKCNPLFKMNFVILQKFSLNIIVALRKTWFSFHIFQRIMILL